MSRLPGRELDALIAEKVMGINPEHFNRSQSYYEIASEGVALKSYSTDIAAAWEVVTHVMKTYRRKISIETYDGEIWSIKPCGTSSKSLPHAICLAALKAVESLS